MSAPDEPALTGTGLPPSRGVSRRRVLGAAASSGWLTACNRRSPAAGGGVAATAAAAPTEAAAEQVKTFLQGNPLPPRYRSQQTQLFQSVPRRELKSRVAQGQPFHWDLFGPTHRYVDAHTGWAWQRPGGDWIDAAGQRHGPQPWFSVNADAGASSQSAARYTVDVTALVNKAAHDKRWLAVLMAAPVTPRTIAGLVSAQHPPPLIEVVLVDGKPGRLRCRVAAGISAASVLPNTAAEAINLPAMLEFDRPEGPVKSARLHFTVTAHWSGRNPLIDGFLLDPPLNLGPVRPGLAQAQAGSLDEGLAAQASVIGVHRYTDQNRLADFVHSDRGGMTSEQHFDPAIYGTGAEDKRRFPHAGLGKWINAGSRWELVNSAHPDEGFAPLAPGLGALRLHMPAEPGLADGAIVGHDGTLAGHAMIFLPEDLYGRLDRIFVRYYLRLGLPGRATPQHRLQVQHAPGVSDWTSLTGKFGIGPDHSTSLGGVSGSSGGGKGWQMRLGWAECDSANGGPDERGWAPGFHLYDFLDNNPAGHRYGSEQPAQFERWGQLGGTGGMLYAGHWYCIETELKLNRLDTTGPGFRPDGELRAWLDGRLVFERSGLVFRTLPIAEAPYNPNKLRPCRALGVRGLWLNWFHGGKTPSTLDRTLFYTGLAWAKDYIGPMKF